MIVVKLTRPEFAIPTVRVVIPGFEVYAVAQSMIGNIG